MHTHMQQITHGTVIRANTQDVFDSGEHLQTLWKESNVYAKKQMEIT